MLLISAAALACAAAPVVAQDSLPAIIKDHWAWTLEQSPTFATSLGVRDYDDQLGDSSLAGFDAAIENQKAILARLEALDAAALTPSDRINLDLLKLDLESEIDASAFGGKYLAITNRRGPHTFITGLPDDLPFFTTADYESYVKRLDAAPAYFEGVGERLVKGVETGWVQPCASMAGFEKTIRFHVVDKPADSALMTPFDVKPAAISAKDWKRLKLAAEGAVANKVVPAIVRFADFY